MSFPEHKITTEILWQGAIIFALIDAIFLIILTRRINGQTLKELRLFLITTAGVFWLFVWFLMNLVFWEPVYHYVFPDWARWLIPPVYGALFFCVALLFWWLSFRIPGKPTLNFCILGGLWGMITHVWGISCGLIDKPPMLKGVSPLSVAVMPIFEFIFYWCIILSISLLLYRLKTRLRKVVE
jgi:hypothetical protein